MSAKVVWRSVGRAHEVDPNFLSFLRVVMSPNRKNPRIYSHNFPKYLDERTGEPKYDAGIFVFGGKRIK